jgi:hypothetical protein
MVLVFADDIVCLNLLILEGDPVWNKEANWRPDMTTPWDTCAIMNIFPVRCAIREISGVIVAVIFFFSLPLFRSLPSLLFHSSTLPLFHSHSQKHFLPISTTTTTTTTTTKTTTTSNNNSTQTHRIQQHIMSQANDAAGPIASNMKPVQVKLVLLGN